MPLRKPSYSQQCWFFTVYSSRACFLVQYSSRSHWAPCSCGAMPKVLNPLEVRNLGSYAEAVKLLDQLVPLFRTVWMSPHSNTWCSGSEDAVVTLENSPGSEWKVTYYWVRAGARSGIAVCSTVIASYPAWSLHACCGTGKPWVITRLMEFGSKTWSLQTFLLLPTG